MDDVFAKAGTLLGLLYHATGCRGAINLSYRHTTFYYAWRGKRFEMDLMTPGYSIGADRLRNENLEKLAAHIVHNHWGIPK